LKRPIPSVPGPRTHDQDLAPPPEEKSWDEILPEVVSCIRGSKNKIGVFISPQLSNEEIYLAQKLFSNVGAVREPPLRKIEFFLFSPKPPGHQDDFLIRADKNPNTKGAQFFGFAYNDETVAEFFKRCEKGEADGVVIFGQDLLTAHGARHAAIGKVPGTDGVSFFDYLKWSVFIGSNYNLTSEYATYVLPSATYAEKEGTFTNFEGRVQKFNKAVEPLDDSRPEWEILTALAKGLGIHTDHDTSEEIFNEMAAKIDAFRGLSYEKLTTGGSDIRVLAEPMIPALQQEADIL